MDCITVDSACTGELMNNGFVFAAKNAICTEANYSYTCLATKGTCKASNCNVELAQGSVTGYKGETLMSAVQNNTCPSPLRQACHSRLHGIESVSKPVPDLYTAEEIVGGIHGDNRLGDNSLLCGKAFAFQHSRWAKGDEVSLAKCMEVPESCSAGVDEMRETASTIKTKVLAELKGCTK